MDLRTIAVIISSAWLIAIGTASEIRSYPLDERSIYTIRLNRDEPTTCVFPAPIKAIVGANVSAKAEDNPGFLLSHEAGAECFSLRPMKDGATGALNILLRGKVYALSLVGGPQPDRAVIFLDEPLAGGARKVPEETLRALVERAKQADRGPAQPASMMSRFDRAQPDRVTLYRSFTATIESIMRFEAEDALVFRIQLANSGDSPVTYDPHGLAVRLGREFFPAAWTEASGAIPPRGAAQLYLVVAGAVGGGRANLSVNEPFSVIVPRL
jgi:hypothetical protein